jgi:hypothetical protein
VRFLDVGGWTEMGKLRNLFAVLAAVAASLPW